MKVLILTSKFGMGHISASRSLAEYIKINQKNADVIVEDVFDHIMPSYKNAMYKAYSLFVNKGSKIYNLFYRFSDNSNSESSSLIFKYFAKKINELINTYQPEMIISTFPVCSKLVSDYKKSKKSNIPFITCITDITSHSEWINKNTDAYLVADKTIKDELSRKGVEKSKIIVTGIPVNEKFKNNTKNQINKLNFTNKSRHKNLLIMGGGLGLLPMSNDFYRGINDLSGVKTTVITAKNKRLFDKLNGVYENIEVVGYTNRVDEYMRKADLIITKPGGITLFESIYSQLPLLVFSPFLLNEINNANFILDKNIGRVFSKNHTEYIDDIKEIIHDDVLLNKFKNNINNIKDSLEEYKLMCLIDYLGVDSQGVFTGCM